VLPTATEAPAEESPATDSTDVTATEHNGAVSTSGSSKRVAAQ